MNPVVRAISSFSNRSGRGVDLPTAVEQRFDSFVAQGVELAAFDLELADGSSRRYGRGPAAFRLRVVTDRGAQAIGAFDELAIAEAYLHGDLDIEGDILAMLRYRDAVMDLHPIQYLLSTYVQPALSGQVNIDQRLIKSHYDVDAEFFVLWLDRRIRGYSHGFFARDDESLEDGMERKFAYAMSSTGIKPGDRVLDVGGGWGSFLEFAGKQGVRVTSVTISDASFRFMNELKGRLDLPCKVVKEHLLAYQDSEPFDAIVNLGVTEHLPDYLGTVRQYEKLLKPGGRVYLDAYSGQRFQMPSFVLKWVFEGNTSPLNPKRYFAALEHTSLEVMEFINDRHDYYLSCKKWAENLEAVRDEVVRRWGELLYRRFRLYLWASASSFLRGTLCAHHMVLEKPKIAPPRSRLPKNFRVLG